MAASTGAATRPDSSAPARRDSLLDRATSVYGVPRPVAIALWWFPWVGAAILAVMLWVPAWHHRGKMLLAEDRLVENFTAIGDFIGALLGAVLLVMMRRRRASLAALGLVAGIAFMSFCIGGEEISWGQRLFHVHLLHLLRGNVQGENTIHNMPLFHDLSEWIPLFLGAIGLAWIHVQTRPTRDRSGVPGILFMHFLVVVILAAYDNGTDWYPIDLKIDTIVGDLSEYVEMLCGFAFAIGMGLVIARERRLYGRAARSLAHSPD